MLAGLKEGCTQKYKFSHCLQYSHSCIWKVKQVFFCSFKPKQHYSVLLSKWSGQGRVFNIKKPAENKSIKWLHAFDWLNWFFFTPLSKPASPLPAAAKLKTLANSICSWPCIKGVNNVFLNEFCISGLEETWIRPDELYRPFSTDITFRVGSSTAGMMLHCCVPGCKSYECGEFDKSWFTGNWWDDG